MQIPARFRESRRYSIEADISLTTSNDTYIHSTVTDISRHGLAIDGLVQVPTGTELHMQFPNGRSLAGHVVWYEGFWMGVRMKTPLKKAELRELMAELSVQPRFGSIPVAA